MVAASGQARFWRAVLALLSLALATCGCIPRAVAFSDDIYSYVGEVNGVSVYLVHSQDRVLVQFSNESSPRRFWDAAVLPDGTVLMADVEKGLVAVRPGGAEELIIAPPGVGDAVRVDPTGRFVAYTYPIKSYGDVLVDIGIGLLDLESGEGPRLLLGLNSAQASPHIVGWLGDRIVFYWRSQPQRLHSLGLDGQQEDLFDLSAHSIRSYLAVRGGFLPYATTDGKVGVVNLVTGEDTRLGFTRLRWAKDGLEGSSGGKGEIVVRVGQ